MHLTRKFKEGLTDKDLQLQVKAYFPYGSHSACQKYLKSRRVPTAEIDKPPISLRNKNELENLKNKTMDSLSILKNDTAKYGNLLDYLTKGFWIAVSVAGGLIFVLALLFGIPLCILYRSHKNTNALTKKWLKDGIENLMPEALKRRTAATTTENPSELGQAVSIV